ncbi:MAG: ATP synthase F1 subunit delta [Elusimicrobia bacterium GWA2_56_46]|nr:MAG: ATP synthase F1 subunit delta [Elusimicrobia bacterium GWA2_56_46]OGR54000.1 MAG: ATP synthase F1 subunit delta [Elusimicrobia bacterium GWC2_56_31]HBB67168.1 ATP synthase F1 subunit delta [Elusimicrobiota bacterium]HBW22109.1 ATP synthase F1 subunit delta [Elusimicrobiota bacterium]
MKSADKTLSKRYARAYMDLGRVSDKPGEAAAGARIAELEKVRNAASQFRRIFLHPLVGCDDKNEILARLLSKELMVSRAAGFVRLLIRENRFYLLEAILEDCMRLYNEYAGLARADVVSRHPLSGEELRRIGAALSASTGRKAHLTQIVSERVLGGVEIRLGDLLIDATVKGRLERLKNSIII